MEKEGWGRVAPLAVFCIVFLLHIVTHILQWWNGVDKMEEKLRKEIRSIHREANALAGPSTFAQAAKMKRVAAQKEKELAQIKKKSKANRHFVKMFYFKTIAYCTIAWCFWRTPIATVPVGLVQPFAYFLSWTWKLPDSEKLIQIGIIPWLSLSTYVSLYLTSAVFTRQKN